MMKKLLTNPEIMIFLRKIALIHDGAKAALKNQSANLMENYRFE
jgi:hypothetical protein